MHKLSALPCWSEIRKDSDEFNGKFVSKIMTKDESNYEINNIKEIKKLDIQDIFTLKNMKVCTLKNLMRLLIIYQNVI